MGNCCCRCSSSNQNPDHDPTPRAIPRADLSSGPAGNTTFGDENFSGNSWYSLVNINVTTWTFQLSSSFTTIWGKNAVESSSVDEDFGNGIINTNSNLRAFTLAQLKAATYNFRPDMVLGRGGFGKVYRGWMKEKVPSKGIRKTAIAIKKLSLTSMQGYQEWMAEITYLGRLSHPNLVKLLGYCKEDDQFLLVYEFMKNGSLNYRLFGKGSVRPLAWEIRLKVAMETARALAYLHTLETPVIYRDFKSSNILLDESFTAKISDFGLAFGEAAADGSHFTSRVLGSLGYSDPLYIATVLVLSCLNC
ncbi:hypothetical protein K2173_016681 [Erythroxylum novogranatense]|uniref:non-specific serine/threonine protein kinase n=1 Tax=Erythroxylum novogranatense TaxID=1862640 RepID=A0AAV8SGU1_9ROSI|nr:hypothetical protein K2173_016681 [Erythroxylum novogranatense]